MVRELIKFHATWCAPCKRVGMQLESLGIEVQDIDVEQNASMASEFLVMSVPVLVVMEDGKEIARHTDSAPEGVKTFLEQFGYV